MTNMYAVWIPTISGNVDSKDTVLFTASSGSAKQWAENYKHVGATYHVFDIGSALPID